MLETYYNTGSLSWAGQETVFRPCLVVSSVLTRQILSDICTIQTKVENKRETKWRNSTKIPCGETPELTFGPLKSSWREEGGGNFLQDPS